MAVYPTWAATTSYVIGSKVRFDGIIFEATAIITGNSANTNPYTDTTNWKAVAINKIQSRSSLYEAIKIEINTADDQINDSIPLFVQMAEESFQTRIRAPIQRVRTTLTTDADGKVEVPQDLLNVINLRISGDTNRGGYLLDRGRTEILAGNIEEYLDLKRYYGNDGVSSRRTIGTPTDYEAPVYWYDDRYFYVAPVLETGTELELYYYASIPQLGTEVFLINSSGEPLNSEGMTSAEWVAEGGGNTAGNFVQDSTEVEQNWFTNAAPQMLLWGSLVAADVFLRDDSRVPMWKEAFEKAEIETKYKIQSFEDGRAHIQTQHNIYST